MSTLMIATSANDLPQNLYEDLAQSERADWESGSLVREGDRDARFCPGLSNALVDGRRSPTSCRSGRTTSWRG